MMYHQIIFKCKGVDVSGPYLFVQRKNQEPVLGFNLLGDGLRDALDPKDKKQNG